jgi:hypothetical protein
MNHVPNSFFAAFEGLSENGIDRTGFCSDHLGDTWTQSRKLKNLAYSNASRAILTQLALLASAPQVTMLMLSFVPSKSSLYVSQLGQSP